MIVDILNPAKSYKLILPKETQKMNAHDIFAIYFEDWGHDRVWLTKRQLHF